MKFVSTLILSFFSSFASAQILNFPDQNFKTALLNSNVVDINQDGEIQTAEALLVTSLSVTGYNISDLTGIKYFVNLQTLNCSGNSLTALDISDMANLISLYSHDNLLTNVNFTGCNSLQSFDCENNKLSHLNFSSLPALENVFCGHNDQLVEIIAEAAPKLRFLTCMSSLNPITYINLKNCDSLQTLRLDDAYIQTLDISGSKKIQYFMLFGSIDNFIARGCTGLGVLQSNITTGGIRYLMDVTGCSNLADVFLSESNLLTIDLSTCINLHNFRIGAAGLGPTNINIKNGSIATLYINPFPPTNPLNICIDDFEMDTVAFMFANYPAPVNISSYCSFFPGGNYNTIKGKVKLDLANNGCDNADPGMPSVPIRITDNLGSSVIRLTTPSGDYAHYPYSGTFTVTPYFPYPYFTTNPANATVVFNTANSIIDTTDFCIHPNGIHNDLEITLLPVGAARPGFETQYELTYKNRGTTTLSGNVQVNFDNSKMNFVYATTNVSSQNAGQLLWNYNNLLPFQSKSIAVLFDLFPAPVNNIGDTLTYLAMIAPSTGDETPDDNSFILPQRITSSFDPNDKQCLEGSRISFADIDKYLHYIIHFQNLGNDTAFNIVVADTLSNKLDWNSVELISSSHTCEVRQKNGNLEFIFENIKLPYKTIDDEGSNGFVAFKVKPISTVTIGDSLNNRAGIYFDFNPPVMTNMATTIVSLVSPIPVKLEYFSGSKKNEINMLTWKAPSTNGSTNFSIERSDDGIHFSSIGNIDASTERCQLPFNFTDNDPLPGKNYYRLKITDVDRIVFYSKILLLENNRTGIETLSVISSKENTIVNLNSDKQQTIQLNVIAADGRLIYSNSTMIAAGNNNIDLKLNKMSAGIYTLIVYTSAGNVITKRFLK